MWNLPNTVLGVIYGIAGHGVGLMACGTGLQRSTPSLRWRDNALQFIHNPFGGVGAVTIGNATIYNGDPYDPADAFWYPPHRFPDGVDPETFENGHSIGKHEEQHTLQ